MISASMTAEEMDKWYPGLREAQKRAAVLEREYRKLPDEPPTPPWYAHRVRYRGDGPWDAEDAP